MPALSQRVSNAIAALALVAAATNATGSQPKKQRAASGQKWRGVSLTPRALGVELAWEWDLALGPVTVDLDLHLHQPASLFPWGGSGGNSADCASDNCVVDSFVFPSPQTPDWFDGVAPPDPVDWYLSPIFAENTCYFLPGGRGAQWQALGLGCHNPRLSLDNISCNPDETDPDSFEYCHPETANIDFMPLNEWTRVGVHYFSNHGQGYAVHPKIRFFCNQELVIELGDAGVGGYVDDVTFASADSGTLFWLVADVILLAHPQTGETLCAVQPLYGAGQTPLYSTVAAVEASFGPPYPEAPDPVFWDGFETGDTSVWSLAIP